MARLKTWALRRLEAYRLFPIYLAGVKKAGWEILWGDGLLFAVFGLYSLRYAVSWGEIVAVCGAAVLIASYHIWRVDHVRLEPKLEFAHEVLRETRAFRPINSTNFYDSTYIQLLPRCCADVPVENCRARLLRVMEWNNGHWERTGLNEPLDLIWSYHDSGPIRLEPGVPQRLNLIAIVTGSAMLEIAPKPLRADQAFEVNKDFRLDIIVMGTDCPPIKASVKIRFGQRDAIAANENLPMPVEAEFMEYLDE